MAATSSKLSRDLPLHVFRPKESLSAFLSNNVRPDGRSLWQSRPIGSKYTQLGLMKQVVGSSQVQIGGTIVLTVIKLMVGVPSPATPQFGDIVFHINMDHLTVANVSVGIGNANSSTSNSSNSSSGNEGYRAGAAELKHLLTAVFSQSKIINFSQLGIVEGTHAYRLSVHITVLSNKGNLRDACIIGVFRALSDTLLPEPIIEPGSTVISVNNDKTQRFSFKFPIISVTFGTIKDGQYILLDPSDEEELVLDGICTVVINPLTSKIHYLTVSTGQTFPQSCLDELLPSVINHAKILYSQMAL